MKMNLPNKLTILRTVMIPFFILFLYTDWFHGYDKIIAAVIFIAASLTDMLDGKIARKYNLVTNFGKFMDPLADKLLSSRHLPLRYRLCPGFQLQQNRKPSDYL